MSSRRDLIVNADDFGLSPGTNRGIIHGHQHGIVTSTSLMVRGAAAAAAARLAREHPRLSVGLHVDLAEWEYRDEQWQLRYAVVPPDDAAAIAAELERQLEMFRSLTGGDPTHLDSHQHVHREQPAHSALRQAARRLGVPLRHFHPPIRYCGEFYGQSNKGYSYPEGITVDALLDIVRQLPAGVTELACHPAAEADMDSSYRAERLVELQSLCDPRVQAAVTAAGVRLCSFRELGPQEPAPS